LSLPSAGRGSTGQVNVGLVRGREQWMGGAYIGHFGRRGDYATLEDRRHGKILACVCHPDFAYGAARLGLHRPVPQPVLRGTRRLDAALCFSPLCCTVSAVSHPFFPRDIIEPSFPIWCPASVTEGRPSAKYPKAASSCRTPRLPCGEQHKASSFNSSQNTRRSMQQATVRRRLVDGTY
jgi:hypothetical protein